MQQAEALTILKTGANVFLTGEPGSGKTHTINQYVSYLRSHGIEPSITASTGIAATHVGGMTIHSWSGVGVRTDLTKYDLDFIAQNKKVSERIALAHVLIVDEVSMLSASLLSMVDAVCREVRRSTQPFGGLQVILVGDFFQLPPVQRDEGVQTTKPHTPFAFTSASWSALNPLVCYLSEQHRQEDTVFLQFLSTLRKGEAGETQVALLRTRYAKNAPEGVTQLYTHNADVDRINDGELAKLSGKASTFSMISRGKDTVVQSLKRGCLSPENLVLKIGARVMCTKNDPAGRYVNGTLGEIIGFDATTGYPLLRTLQGRTLTMTPEEWKQEDGGKILAKIAQIPLRLAWAITVHKSQGMSLDAAHMDLSGAFEYGQGYVALSRVRTLAGLSLAGLHAKALAVHPIVREKDAQLREKSDKVRDVFAGMTPDEVARMHAAFIRTCGGSNVPVQSVSHINTKEHTTDVTYSLVQKGCTVEEIVEKRAMTMGTIITHLEKLHKEGKVTGDEVAHCARAHGKDIEKAKKAWKDVGGEKITPIFIRLKGTVPHTVIRLARICT